MEYNEVVNLIRELDQSSIRYLELEAKGVSLKLNKDKVSYVQGAKTVAETEKVINQASSAVVSTEEIRIENKEIIKELVNEDAKGEKVLSPMVGTFYSKSSPDQPPYVKVGDRVEKGQILCIIEAMKLMNEIESDYSGTVKAILANDEEMVEFGQSLFLIS